MVHRKLSLLIVKLTFALVMVAIGVALVTHYSLFLRERERAHELQLRALEDAKAGRHYEACQGYREMQKQRISIDDTTRDVLVYECFKVR